MHCPELEQTSSPSHCPHVPPQLSAPHARSPQSGTHAPVLVEVDAALDELEAGPLCVDEVDEVDEADEVEAVGSPPLPLSPPEPWPIVGPCAEDGVEPPSPPPPLPLPAVELSSPHAMSSQAEQMAKSGARRVDGYISGGACHGLRA